jgi:hypothetical protein
MYTSVEKDSPVLIRFAECLPLIYPPELEVKETTNTASSASFH